MIGHLKKEYIVGTLVRVQQAFHVLTKLLLCLMHQAMFQTARRPWPLRSLSIHQISGLCP